MMNDPLITAYAVFVAALLGLAVGSFVNCWAWRYMHGESVVRGRSHCTSCGHELGALDLIPIVSWVVSGGKCRYCGQKVSVRYPITEAVCALVFAAIVAVYGVSLETVELLIFASVLLFLSLTDLDDYLIPNGCIIVAIVVRVIYLAIAYATGQMDLARIGFYVASAFGMGIVLLVIVLVADKAFGRDSMGGGDLKLYFVAGLYFGWQQGLLVVILSCIIGIVVAFLAPARKEVPGGSAETGVKDDDAGAGIDGLQVENPSNDQEPVNGANEDMPGSCHIEADACHTEADACHTEADACHTETDADSLLESARPAAAQPAATQPEAAQPAAAQPEAARPDATQPESTLRRVIPFGPSIAAACVITMLVGNQVVSWYLSLL